MGTKTQSNKDILIKGSKKKDRGNHTLLGKELGNRYPKIKGYICFPETPYAFDFMMQDQEVYEHQCLKKLDMKSLYHSKTLLGESTVDKPKLWFYTNMIMVPPYSNYTMFIWKSRNPKWIDQLVDYFIDPGIKDLVNYGDYKYREKITEYIDKNDIPSNCHITMDYPIFLAANEEAKVRYRDISRYNNQKWGSNSHYVCVIQPLKYEADAWIKEYEYLAPVFEDKKEKVLGIGGLVPISEPNSFTHEIFSYITSRADHLSRIHFYGMGQALCERHLPKLIKKGVKCSVDHVKWIYNYDESFRKWGYVKYPRCDAAVACYLQFIQRLRQTFNVIH